MSQNNFPKLHNATWPGIVGKGADSEPVIPFDTLLAMTAAAEVDGVKFDGLDLGLLDPHFKLDDSDETKVLAEKLQKNNLVAGSLVAPIWAGSAMGTADQRATFVDMVRKACEFGKKLRDQGVRPYGVIRIDSAAGVEDWAKDPAGNTKIIAETFREACDVAAGYGEKLATEGEICWGAMHSWKHMVELLEMVDRPNIGFQADMSHTFLYTMGYNAPEHRILPKDADLNDREAVKAALKIVTDALRPWTIDFHVAQNDGSVFGQGSHDKTGRHCQATDPNGVLDIAHDAGYWLRDEKGELTKAFKHICWDGCMFPNDVMNNQQTWNDILAALVKVRNAHGWKA
ncbi:sugar phosphate isomerase/epimerase family protein [Algoriphagus aquimarinus]|uniref:Sugar phosphate isomerase/epimerase n=1 Tax=Algoriphagus aquimarinus TaxID=237018 RepID=A0A1I1C0Z2_9BACT|nr:TIM barrel protein [Algoriphagus aquimarinus]SFB56295.1 Sugar phosphate isomerase/epimerase [Algoriphagus aquimarinus]|tara:strand:- start:71126 stop:72154 length:1029 start_codon:yes stop_codon:yes gene_type:complete